MIEDFLADLEVFATGSYLRPEERAWWTPPFPVEALVELRYHLEGILGDIASAHSDEEVRLALRSFEADLNAFNERYAGAVIEAEEEAEITAILQQAYANRRAQFAE